jgi:thiamine biosynthesis lipoprotein
MRQIRYPLVIVLLFFIGFIIAWNSNTEIKTINRTQIFMGTVVDIQVRNSDPEIAEEAVTKAFSEIKRIDNLFTISNESPVKQLNQNKDSIIIVDEEIYRVMVLCDSLWRISSGSFDASIGSIINIWGFDKKSPALPDYPDIKAALMESGWDKIKLFESNKFFHTGNPDLDFSAVAKGYAVDRAVNILKEAGINEALVNAGGEIKSTGGSWIIGVQHPREKNQIIKKIKLNGMSAATSGDYQNYFEENGIRYHHLINPATGLPAKGIQSVTVLHKDNAFADGLATAVFVLGKERGISLAEELSDTEAMIIDNEGDIFYTSGFDRYIIK